MAVLEFQQSSAVRKQTSAISIKNVLYATDFSATSGAAFPYATAICRHFGSTLHVAHVLSNVNLLMMTGGADYANVGMIDEDAHTLAQEKIQQITAGLGKIPYRTYVGHGQVWTHLNGIVTENAIDLIVVGTLGRTGMSKLLLGSVAESILRHAICPVLTAGPNISGRAKLPELKSGSREVAPVDLELRNILYATKLTLGSLMVTPVAIALAEEFEACLTLMHVFESYPDLCARPGPIEAGVQQLHAAVPKDAALPYPPEVVMEFGSAPKCIVKTAVEREADLIVLGARQADYATHLPWTTVHEVIAHAPCPVLTVPA